MKNKFWRKWVFIFFVSIPCILGFIAVVNYTIDPFQFYRESSNPMFSTNQRYQNPGLVKNYEYDTLVLGTSMSENFRKSYVDSKLGVNSLRASFSGGTIYEQFLAQNLSIDSNKGLRRIIWILDVFALSGQPTASIKSFPQSLYTGDVRGTALEYLLSSYVLMESVFKIIGFYSNRDMETLNNWNDDNIFSVEEVLSTYERQEFVYSPDDSGDNNFELNVENYMKLDKNSEVEYNIIFPPYSFLFYCLSDYKPNFKFMNSWQGSKMKFVSIMSKFKNVSIYDFQDAYEIIYDLNNYKDSSHYSQKINDWMIDRIAEKDKRYLVTDEEEYQRRGDDFVRAINMASDFGILVTKDNLEEHLEFLRKNILEALSREPAP